MVVNSFSLLQVRIGKLPLVEAFYAISYERDTILKGFADVILRALLVFNNITFSVNIKVTLYLTSGLKQIKSLYKFRG